jgi:hypothetical protein
MRKLFATLLTVLAVGLAGGALAADEKPAGMSGMSAE